MRKILFRGKTEGKRWVYGSLILAGTYCCILEPEDNVHPMDYPYLDDFIGTIDGQATPVVRETVGQWTGLVDRNGAKIFEGDIVKTEFGRLCTIVWFSSRVFCGWDLETIRTVENCVHTKSPTTINLFKPDCLEIIGNIHDNPELLEVK